MTANNISWLGTFFGMLGAVLVAANTGMQDFGYICYLLGAIIWLVVSIVRKDNSGILLWGFFAIVNIFGIFSYVH